MRPLDRQRVADRRAARDAGRDHEEGDRDTDDVGTLDIGRCQRPAAVDDQPVRIAQRRVDAEFRQLRAPVERAFVDLVPEQRRAFGAHAERDEDRQQVGRHVGPGRGLDLLHHRRGERRPNPQRPGHPGPAEPVAVLELDAELEEGALEQREQRRHAVLHRHVAAGDGAEREEGGDLVEVVVEGVVGAAQRVDAVDHEMRAAAAGDARAHPREKGAELLDVRLAGGIDEGRAAGRDDGAEHEILGRGDRCVVEPVVGADQPARRPDRGRAVLQLHFRAEREEGMQVRIDLARAERAAGDVVLEPGHAEALQQRRHQHDRRAHARWQARRSSVARAAMAEAQRAALDVDVDSGAQRAEEREELPHVGDVGHAVQHEGRVAQERRAQDRQHGVLVRRRSDGALERAPAVNDQVAHRAVRKWFGAPVFRAAVNPR